MIKRVFTVKDSAPWVAVAAIALAVAVVAAVYVRDMVGLAILETACGSILTLLGAYYWRRWEEVKLSRSLPHLMMGPVIVKGVVLIDGTVIKWAPWEAYGFWSERFTSESDRDKMFDALDDAEVTFVPEPFLVDGVLAGGSCRGNQITVVGKPSATTERTAALLKHEFSHLILSALGVPVERHHEEFEKAGLGC